MSVITLEEYKKLANIKVSDFDAQITELIPNIEEDILAIRNCPWELDSNYNPIYPYNIKMIAAEMISYKINTLKGAVGVSSEHLGDYSVSYSSEKFMGYPKSITSRIKRYGKLK